MARCRVGIYSATSSEISDLCLPDTTRAMMTGMMRNRLEEGFMLDRRWFWLRGEMERTKRPALLALARIFAEAEVPYAIIGGIALQVHQAEPRTTLDIDVAVVAYGMLPRIQLEAAGFTCTGRCGRPDSWVGPGRGAGTVYRRPGAGGSHYTRRGDRAGGRAPPGR